MENSKIFLGCTSNIISSGLRDTVAHLARNKLVDVMVISGGGVEEDIIKTLFPHKVASFELKGRVLRENGLNRVGNLVIPNESYFQFEQWLTRALDAILEGYTESSPRVLTPSAFIHILGTMIECEESVLHWASRNRIPVYSPAVTDGSIGDILTFYPRRSSLKLDIVEDTYNMNHEAMFEEKTSAIILGGGLVKHHILNANLFKNGLDYCVIVNTSSDFDGSDAGANIEEAVSWGKIKIKNSAVKIFGDATLVFPLLVAGSFLSGSTRSINAAERNGEH
ncbi:UNVERIFIED_CONTAM: hypothetical protein PYX00_011866 [Menopon gallinae]|uniref:Deoxyhypusine synthase n=1 Tax=Menopon gallinae TaxID=328185 RepID=A0AAW2H8R2_9NEOP